MKKDTEKLISEIKDAPKIESFIRENTGEFQPDLFLRTLKDHFAATDFTQVTLAEKSNISTTYLHDILQGSKKPKRDTVLKLSIGLHLELDEANRLLMLAGHGSLYPRVPRDAIVLFCINKGISIIETNCLLDEQNEKLL